MQNLIFRKSIVDCFVFKKYLIIVINLVLFMCQHHVHDIIIQSKIIILTSVPLSQISFQPLAMHIPDFTLQYVVNNLATNELCKHSVQINNTIYT